jgi:hypothetical protein
MIAVTARSQVLMPIGKETWQAIKPCLIVTALIRPSLSQLQLRELACGTILKTSFLWESAASAMGPAYLAGLRRFALP